MHECLETKLKDIPDSSTYHNGALELDPKHKITLYEFQQESVSWMTEIIEGQSSCILGDEMGLGKTIQIISLLANLQDRNKDQSMLSLIVCPLSVVYNWMNHLDKYGSFADVRYCNAEPQVLADFSRIASCHTHSGMFIGVTSFETVMNHSSSFNSTNWSCLVIDEGHRLKNIKSVLRDVLTHVPSTSRILLSGTPVQNHLKELYSLIAYIKPDLFTDINDDAFCDYYSCHLSELKFVLNRLMIRRLICQVSSSLPMPMPKLKQISLHLPLTPIAKKIYLSVLLNHFESFSFDVTSRRKISVNCLSQLRRAANHPYLLSGVEPQPFTDGDHVYLSSSKLSFLVAFIHRLAADGLMDRRKMLIYSTSTDMLDVVQDVLNLIISKSAIGRSVNYVRLDGSVRAEERWSVISSFSSSSSSSANIFLLSTHAGGVGMNLQGDEVSHTDIIIFLDEDWNPHVDHQAMCRAYRIGQFSDQVTVIKLISCDTIDEIVHSRCDRKMMLSRQVLDDDDETVGDGELCRGLSRLCCSSSSSCSDASHILSIDNTDLIPTSVSHDIQSTVDDIITNHLSSSSSNEDGSMTMIIYPPGHDVNNNDDDDDIYSFEGTSYAKLRQTQINLTSQLNSVVSSKRKRISTIKSATDDDDDDDGPVLNKLWLKNGYTSTSLDIMSSSSSVPIVIDAGVDDVIKLNYVYGDATQPPSSSSIILQVVDTSGSWPNRGFFRSLSDRWSASGFDVLYRNSKKNKDLKLGQVHIYQTSSSSVRVALCVCQSSHGGQIDQESLSSCLEQLSLLSLRSSSSIHLPRIGFKTINHDWYSIERLLKLHFIDGPYPSSVFVYYHKKSV